MEFDDLEKRLSYEEIRMEAAIFSGGNPYAEALNMVKTMVLILDKTRQIVFANKELISKLGFLSLEQVLGKRPGEIVNCIHAADAALGCGTVEACKNCSALNIVLKSMHESREVSGTAGFVTRIGHRQIPVEIELSITPFITEAGEFYVATMNDIRDSIRRTEMERVFFHDVLNSAGALRGYIQLLRDELPPEFAEELNFVHGAFVDVIELIKVQKVIGEMSTGDPVLNMEWVSAEKLLRDVKVLMEAYGKPGGRQIVVSVKAEECSFCTDVILVKRILINMIKNALEASDKNGVITCGCGRDDSGRPVLWVHNQGFIPEDVQERLFQKAFSTRAIGRGWGTYSMKLLGEGVLGGVVDYQTSRESGTRFYLVIPHNSKGECSS